MSKEISAPFAPSVPTPSASSAAPPAPSRIVPLLRGAGIVSIGTVLAGSALAAVCAHLAVPLFFTPVPLSLQPFAVLLLGLMLSPRMAAATFAAYLVEGAAGLPVFAPIPATSGLAHLFGPTGGFLLAYPLAAALISYLWRRTGRGFWAALASAALGDLLILGCGGLWLALFMGQPAHFSTMHLSGMHLSGLSGAALAILAFLPGDALKVAAAAAFACGALRLRRNGFDSAVFDKDSPADTAK
jgi:biotin transport system substrate-specific component